MTQAALVLTTVSTADQARSLAERLVQDRLAACVSVGAPVESCFRWNGEVTVESEVPLTIKTDSSRIAELTQWLCDNHPYDEPEVLALHVAAGSESYLRWVRNEVTLTAARS